MISSNKQHWLLTTQSLQILSMLMHFLAIHSQQQLTTHLKIMHRYMWLSMGNWICVMLFSQGVPTYLHSSLSLWQLSAWLERSNGNCVGLLGFPTRLVDSQIKLWYICHHFSSLRVICTVDLAQTLAPYPGYLVSKLLQFNKVIITI